MTYNKEIAEVEPRTQEEWLNLLLEDGSEYWGEDITERNNTAIHQFYEPYAGRLAELEQQLQQVQHSLRVKDAEGQALDYLGDRLGINRRLEEAATGEVVFSRENASTKDYLIQSGTIVETGGEDSVQFETTENVTLPEGGTSVVSGIEAVGEGSHGNVASGTITTSPESVVGVDSINNPKKTFGGREKELDENYRERILFATGKLDVTSGQQIFNALSLLEYVEQVRYIDNSSDSASDGLNAHEVELIIDAEEGHNDEIAQVIFDSMAMGANLVSGIHGTATTGTASLSNGQTFTIKYSIPTEVEIYVDVDVSLKSEINNEKIKNAVVEYIGGVKTNGQQLSGELNVSDDVLHGEVEFAIRTVEGVYDVTSLAIGTSDSPTGTSNISIASTEVSTIDASNITLTTSNN